MDENSNAGMYTPQIYQLRIKGHLESRWAAWFEGLEVSLDQNGETLLTGIVADQAVLHGLLKKVRDLGLNLVSVSPLDPDQEDQSNIHQ